MAERVSIVNTNVGFSKCVAFSTITGGGQSLYHFVCECGTEFNRKANTRNKAWFTQLNCGCKTKQLLAETRAKNKAMKAPVPIVENVDGLTCINCKHERGYVCMLSETNTGDHGECLQWSQTEFRGTLHCKDEVEMKGAILNSTGYVKLQGKGR